MIISFGVLYIVESFLIWHQHIRRYRNYVIQKNRNFFIFAKVKTILYLAKKNQILTFSHIWVEMKDERCQHLSFLFPPQNYIFLHDMNYGITLFLFLFKHLNGTLHFNLKSILIYHFCWFHVYSLINFIYVVKGIELNFAWIYTEYPVFPPSQIF